MKKTLIGVLIAAATTMGTAAFAQPPQAAGPDPSWTPPSVPQPPPPPQAPAAPAYQYSYAPPAPAVTVVAPAPANGQWVYTNQYGWIWVPYSAEYTYAPSADVAYTYAYYPRYGWRWVSSPWVLNIGPTPFWGRLGPVHFAWYGHPRSYVVARGGWRAPARPVYRAPAPYVAARGVPVRANHGDRGHHGDHGNHYGHRR